MIGEWVLHWRWPVHRWGRATWVTGTLDEFGWHTTNPHIEAYLNRTYKLYVSSPQEIAFVMLWAAAALQLWYAPLIHGSPTRPLVVVGAANQKLQLGERRTHDA
jgi:hypothetical protein